MNVFQKLVRRTRFHGTRLLQSSKPLDPSRTRGPIVVAALGGSGTRAIVELLVESGVYMGRFLDRDTHDSLYVRRFLNAHFDALVRDPETQQAPPTWLSIEGSHLKGTPKKEDIGNTQFGLSVRSGDEGSVARLFFTVEAIPEWKHSPLDLGIQNERENFKLDLNAEVKNDVGGALEFSSPNLKAKAPWLELSKEGILYVRKGYKKVIR